jgi:hypothetical protein
MSEVAVAQLRSRMLKDTEGFLSKKLSLDNEYGQSSKIDITEYMRRFGLQHGFLIRQMAVDATGM